MIAVSLLEDLFSLRGKVALVSGASRGIGWALAAGLEQAGARVVATARSASPQQSTFSQNLTYRACDVRDERAFRALCREVVKERGGLGVYVHAAGVSVQLDDEGSALPAFAQTVETNLTAAYACCLAAGEEMARRGGGSIITITSIGGIQGFPRNPGYVASKGGLRLLTRAMALDFGDKGIRVNAIAPGYIRTAMTEENYQDAERRRQRLDRMIIQRWGVPEDLIGAAIFLASDASSYITGQEIVVDGGWTARGL